MKKDTKRKVIKTTTGLLAMTMVVSPMTTFAVNHQEIQHDVLVSGTDMDTSLVRPDQSFQLFINQEGSVFKPVRQQLENQSFGVLLVGSNGEKEFIDAKIGDVLYKNGTVEVKNHTEFNAYTEYKVEILVKSDYQQARKGKFPSVDMTNAVTFQTGSALNEPTKLTVANINHAPSVMENTTIPVHVTDDYGLPAKGEVSIKTVEEGTRLENSIFADSSSKKLVDGKTEFILGNHEAENVNVHISVEGIHGKKTASSTLSYQPGNTDKIELFTEGKFFTVGKKINVEGKAFDKYENPVKDGLIIEASSERGALVGSKTKDGAFSLQYATSSIKGNDVLTLRLSDSDKVLEKEVYNQADKAHKVTPKFTEIEEGQETILAFDIQDQYGNLVEDNEIIQLSFEDKNLLDLTTETKDGVAQFTFTPESSGNFIYSIQTTDGFLDYKPKQPLIVSGNEDKHFTIDINKDVEVKEDGSFQFQEGTWTYSGDRKKTLTSEGEFSVSGNGSSGQYSHVLNDTTATFELDVKSISNGGPETGFNSVMLIRTGNTGLSVAFFPDKLVIGDNPFSPKMTYFLNASEYHTYRIVKDENIATVYVDGKNIGAFTLSNGTGYGQRQFFFGDGTYNSFPSETYYKNIRIAPGKALYIN